jgi:hypothetical protein
MKTSFLKLSGCSFILLAMACNNNPQTVDQSPIQKPDSAVQDRTNVSNVDTTEQMAFIRHEEELINENNNKITELKTKIKNEKKAIAREYNEQLDTLHERNERMEQRLNKIKEQGKKDWANFKHDFNKDMDSLGKSISRFAEKNMAKNK